MDSKDNNETQAELSPRLRDLQKKIKDENYINWAIDRIAVIVSRQLVGTHSTTERGTEMTF